MTCAGLFPNPLGQHPKWQPKALNMRNHSQTSTRLALASLYLGVHSAAALAATQTISLTEHLGKKWTNELVSYPFSAGQGQAAASSIAVTLANQNVPAQLVDTEFWPNTQFVKSARLLFVASDLEPTSTNTYTVTSGTAPAAAPVTDLKVTSGDGWVELSTSQFAARLLTGEKTYDVPAAAAQVPGPLVAIRVKPDDWEGGSTLYGDLAVKSWSADLVESGPVRARVQYRYVMADESTITFEAAMVAGDDEVLWRMDSSGDSPQNGINFTLPKLPGLTQASVPKSWGQWGRPHTVAVTAGATPFLNLTPNTSVANSFPDCASNVVLKGGDGTEIDLVSRDPGAWAQPKAPLTYGGYPTWNLDMIPKAWDNWRRKQMPISYAADGTITLQADFASGQRVWSLTNGAPLVGQELDTVKDLVLDWPQSKRQHPFLFEDQSDLEAAWKRNPPSTEYYNPGLVPDGAINGEAVKAFLATGENEDLAKSKVVPQLHSQLGLLGDYDVMRYGIAAAGLYDALVDTDFVTPADRKVLRAQMAYLGYKMADPMMWSIERGYHTGNPNMSISYTLTLGIVACAIPDHPMAKTWTTYANSWMNKWLTDEVGPNGEWIPEGSHYGLTSLIPLVTYAVAAQRAGFHDFLTDPRFKKLILFYAKESTPRNPLNHDERVSPSVGRGTSSDANGIYGVVARATAKTDPEFSRTMQWLWAQENYPVEIGDWRMGGFEQTYMDKTLPAEQPDWASESFPSQGAVLRDGLGTDLEHYVNVIAFDDSKLNLDIWTPEVGNIAEWFAYGKPLSKQFTFDVGYKERHELLRGGVALARNGGGPGDAHTPFGYYTTVSGQDFSTFPRADYVTGTYTDTTEDDRDWYRPDMPVWPKVTPATAPNLRWTRQTLFVKDESAAGPHYLVLRDTTAGGQPTTWQFWTLSDKLGTADQAKDPAFLADKPGEKILSASALPMSDRYTAIGQFGVDVDYYIAAPGDTPRYTLRYGGTWIGVPEYQDVLHLQAPGDGAYFVLLYPHPHGAEVPTFTTLGEGRVIKVSGGFGTDYDFLSQDASSATAENASFQGTAASVQDRKGTTTLCLDAGGSVTYGAYSLTAPAAASLRAEGSKVTVNITGSAEATGVTLGLPGEWKLAGKVKGVDLKAVGPGRYQVTASGGTTVELVAR